MNRSKLFKKAILNLYKSKIYTVDYAILKATDYADKNKITAEDYEELLIYLAEEQEKEIKVEEVVEENVETEEIVESEENTEKVDNEIILE